MSDTIDGRGGYDEVNYTDSPSSMTIDLSQSIVTDGWGNDDTIANIEGVEATPYDDTITGTSGNNSLDGRGGNNTIDGGGGFDYVEYNGGGRTNVNANLETGIVTFTGRDGVNYTDTLLSLIHISEPTRPY